MPRLRFSIITPSFNQRQFIEQTGQSILTQIGNFDLTWHVIDGGSTDGTIDYLQSLGDPRIRWISEKDAGQADAVNKGLAIADGDIIGWLNSDDVYAPHALEKVRNAFTDERVQWVVGRYAIVDERGNPIRSAIARYKEWFLSHYTYGRLLRENFIAQPAVFWRREFGQHAGRLDVNLHYTMDYDLWLRMGKLANPKIRNDVISHFRIHGQSKSGQVNREQFDEGYRVAKRYCNGRPISRVMHRFNVEKIVWAYRVLRVLGI